MYQSCIVQRQELLPQYKSRWLYYQMANGSRLDVSQCLLLRCRPRSSHGNIAYSTLVDSISMDDGLTCMAFTVSFVPNTGNKLFMAACDAHLRLYDFEEALVCLFLFALSLITVSNMRCYCSIATPNIRRHLFFLLRLWKICTVAR